ncbi:hypothetical protein EQZ20_07045 [Bacillus glycinifermentans]|uniref:Uncharacterized protein n=1 Tax=Bacillus glycinifermentans TaxID=1664069 RepID=A0AAJ3Z415_9BACI|nr:hypothetical protein [Bacillus glycinifermentans]QAT67807.1 hypothetical protein EQZ20_07045 [Bacillus glycinifermentans]
MAKLTGVKTIDMVNGEITKVAYEGAEYVRVEGTPRNVGRVGDILLNVYDHPDLKVNSFYKIVHNDEYGETIYDEVEDSHRSALAAGVVFRKVSEAQPSLEDRVSTNEKDIAALKSDVAALKGEAEPKYIRIDKSEAKAGDFVKFDEAPNECLTAGKYYEIYRVDGCGDPQIRDDDGDGFDTYCADDFEVYRKVSSASAEAEPKPERLKVGDYAKVDYTFNSQSKRGDIVKITEDDNSIIPFLTEHLNGDNAGWFAEDPLVRATNEEVAEAKRKQAEEEERKRWAAIGREVDEYKVGDIVQYLYDREICEVVDVDEDGRVEVATQNHGICVENQSSIELVAPVEARFDRKDDE